MPTSSSSAATAVVLQRSAINSLSAITSTNGVTIMTPISGATCLWIASSTIVNSSRYGSVAVPAARRNGRSGSDHFVQLHASAHAVKTGGVTTTKNIRTLHATVIHM